MSITLKSILQTGSSFSIRELDGEVIFFEETGKEIHSAGETGLFIFNQIDGKKSTSEIAELLFNEYDIAKEIAESDTIEFLNELLKHNIIKIKK